MAINFEHNEKGLDGQKSKRACVIGAIGYAQKTCITHHPYLISYAFYTISSPFLHWKIINPWRACAVRVMVAAMSVCVSVCPLNFFRIKE